MRHPAVSCALEVTAIAAVMLLAAACGRDRSAEVARLKAEIARLEGELRESEAHLARLKNELGTRLEARDAQAGVTMSPDALLRECEELLRLLIRATVTGVQEAGNQVRLSVGRDDGVKVDYEFTVYRGTEYVARVVIRRVEKDFCYGESRPELQKSPIRVGDQATTRF